MTKAYLLLLTIVADKDIYIDHDRQSFIIHYHNEDILIKCEEVKDFISIFNEGLDNMLKELNINKHGEKIQ